ncbi:MAG: transcription-repair coupling factor [Alphaproteobacteria bacterium]|nr:transcription-repair coupling factor [Alphaproteobacteria bacterium]
MPVKSFQTLCGVPRGYEAFALAELVKKHPHLLHVAADDMGLALTQDALKLIAPGLNVLTFPAWDTVPYDRVSPRADIVGARLSTLIELLQAPAQKTIVLTTAAALMQRVVPKAFLNQAALAVRPRGEVSFTGLLRFLTRNGYRSSSIVMEAGEYAVRGGIVDVFPAGSDDPVRLDFFGDDLESIRVFDATSQRTTAPADQVVLKPVSEFVLTDESAARFRTKYRELFDRTTGDAFYDAVSEGRAVQGIEHFLPLFYDGMETLFDYLPDAACTLEYQAAQAMDDRAEQVREYHDARAAALAQKLSPPYPPIPPELLFLSVAEAQGGLHEKTAYLLSPFVEPDTPDMFGRAGRSFVDVRVREQTDVFKAVADYIRAEKRPVILAAATIGSARRLIELVQAQNGAVREAQTWAEALRHAPAAICAPFEKGFATPGFIVITETDILGDRIVRPARKKARGNILADITALNIGDLVVHQKHGIGRFAGLAGMRVGEALHDCLRVDYDGGDKLFVPVENADVLSRYGNAENVALDKLGGTQFEARRARVKKDLFAMAEKLMAVASERALKRTDKILPPHEAYTEFCARFPYAETDDQARTIAEIEGDLSAGKPMDRLVCGDVGFGKTEVAMRAAFLSVMAGHQVAVVVPTTLLARQHLINFRERFAGFPVRIGGLSRLVSAADAAGVRKGLEDGTLDIVIGTHALLAKSVRFKHLGMVVVDEEQHFGVAHKERLKELKKGIHVLTLTATPIPRTLQLSLSGVRELSVIATPPVDRLAVKTFIAPFDPVIIKEAILREHFRGGQVFFVCPRIADMPEVAGMLAKLLPDIKVVQAHGQMPAAQLEKIMTAFGNRQYDVLLATSIIESGLDMAFVNTIVIHRADMFGLAALYQLRGRVGRGKLKAYAYLTTPPDMRITETARKRLAVMQGLDSLGAGFTLASHDLDIRGAGNLLGDDQSGHIREIGIALYQKMLADAVRSLRQSDGKAAPDDDFSPQLSLGIPVLIPESYVSDLDTRMALYRRLGEVSEPAEVESMRAELLDRFGPYPQEADNLLAVIGLKLLARRAHVERLDAGPKGATLTLYRNAFPNTAGLLAYIATQSGIIKITPQQKILVSKPWETPADRLRGVRDLLARMASIAENP